MTLSTQPADTDLLVPLPGPDEPVHPYTVHTHYFGFTIPEAGIGHNSLSSLEMLLRTQLIPEV